MSWGKRLPRSQSPIVVGDTPAALAKARSEGSPASGPALKARSASSQGEELPAAARRPALAHNLLLCPPLSSRPLDTRQRKAATSAISKTSSRSFLDTGLDSKPQPISPQPRRQAPNTSDGRSDAHGTGPDPAACPVRRPERRVHRRPHRPPRRRRPGPGDPHRRQAPPAPSWRFSSPPYPPTANHERCRTSCSPALVRGVLTSQSQPNPAHRPGLVIRDMGHAPGLHGPGDSPTSPTVEAQARLQAEHDPARRR